MMGGIEHKSSFCHVGYLTVFFIFYHLAKSLDDNFWAVFAAGLTVLGLESYHIRNYCHEEIKKELDAIAGIPRHDDRDID